MPDTQPATTEELVRGKLRPEVLRWSLAVAGLVAATHEVIKSLILHAVRDFLVFPGHSDDRYAREVLRFGSNRFEASCKWLVAAGALDDEDLVVLARFKVLRDTAVHDLFKVAFDAHSEFDVELLARVSEVVRKLDLFWVRIEIDANPSLDGRDIPDEEIASGAAIFLGTLVDALVEPYIQDAGKDA